MSQLLNLLSLLGIASNFGILLLYWNDLPEKVPTHFGVTGAADAWGSKQSLILLPVIALSIYVVVTLAVRFGSTGNSLVKVTPENAERQRAVAVDMTAWIKAEVAWMFTFIDWRTIQVALDRAEGLGWQFLPVVLVVVFGTIGYYVWLSYQQR